MRPFCSASLAPAAPAPRALAAVLDALLLVVTWNLTSTFIDLVLRPLPVSNFAMGQLTRTTVTVGSFAVPEVLAGRVAGQVAVRDSCRERRRLGRHVPFGGGARRPRLRGSQRADPGARTGRFLFHDVPGSNRCWRRDAALRDGTAIERLLRDP